MRSIILPVAALLCGACGGPPVAESPDVTPSPTSSARRPPLEPVLSVPAPGPRPHRPIPEEDCRCIRICIVQRGRLLEVPATWNPATGDTLTEDGRPFSSIAPLTGEYASVAGWYVNNEPIRFRGSRYVRYSQPRVLGTNEIVKAGEYQRVGVYVERGDTSSAPQILFLPTRPGCEFQPYERMNHRTTRDP